MKPLKHIIANRGSDSAFGEVWLNVYRPTRIAIELLKEKIEELHQIIVSLFCKNRKKIEKEEA
jgi:hypothetical protein